MLNAGDAWRQCLGPSTLTFTCLLCSCSAGCGAVHPSTLPPVGATDIFGAAVAGPTVAHVSATLAALLTGTAAMGAILSTATCWAPHGWDLEVEGAGPLAILTVADKVGLRSESQAGLTDAGLTTLAQAGTGGAGIHIC
jgi:hypothetical protein